jgi:hypothetical protein
MEPWMITMLLVCAAAALLGYITAFLLDEWRNR